MSNKIAKGTGLPKKSGGGGNRKYNNMPEYDRPIKPFSGAVSGRVNDLLLFLKKQGLKPTEINGIIFTALIEVEQKYKNADTY